MRLNYAEVTDDIDLMICAECGNMIDGEREIYTYNEDGNPICSACGDLL